MNTTHTLTIFIVQSPSDARLGRRLTPGRATLRGRFTRGLAVAALSALGAVGATACDGKSDVHTVRAKAVKARPSSVDPKVASTVAAAAKAVHAAQPAAMDAPPLPPGHGNTLPPGHPAVQGMAVPAAQVPAGGAHAAQPGAPAPIANDKQGPSGVVAEVLPAGRYTYLRIGTVWSAVPMAKIAVGQDVAVVGAMKMTNFVSKATGRTFPTVWFGNLAVTKGAPAAAAPKPAAPAAVVNVAKATGANAMTIGQVFAQQASLAGKRVRIQGKVVKYNEQIMGKNWLHIQDGTGDAAAKTHDLTITSASTAAVGDTVVIDGVIALKRDFGAGYAYDVIVEQATVSPAPVIPATK